MRLGFTVAVAVLSCVGRPVAAASDVDDDEPRPWAEEVSALPASSVLVRPIKVDLGPGSDNVFSVDAASLAVGGDGVIRYIFSVASPTGATTVSYEGIRCSNRERRTYGYGRADGTWSPARHVRWDRIEPKTINGYANVLYRDYFCPNGIIVRDVAEAVMALERGGIPVTRIGF